MKKKEFILDVKKAIDKGYLALSPEGQMYFDELLESIKKPPVTQNGVDVLSLIVNKPSEGTRWITKEIAENLGISTKSVAGVLVKLITDGYAVKISSNPTEYGITDKGRAYLIQLAEEEGINNFFK